MLRGVSSVLCGIRPPSTSGGANGAALPAVQAELRLFLIQAVQEVQNAGGAKRCRVKFFNTGGAGGAKCRRCKAVQSGIF